MHVSIFFINSEIHSAISLLTLSKSEGMTTKKLSLLEHIKQGWKGIVHEI